MDQARVYFILEALAHGINPLTGEILPDESPYNQPEIIRALFTASRDYSSPKPVKPEKKAKKTKEEKQQENLEKGLPRNYGLAWSEADIQQVIADFQQHQTIDEIARALERKPTAIIGLLHKQQIITDEQAFVLRTSYT